MSQQWYLCLERGPPWRQSTTTCSLEPAALWLLDHPCGFGKTKWSDNSCTSAEDMAAWMVSVPDDLREAVAFLEPAAKSLLDPLMMTNALMIVMESGITDINRKLSKSER